MPFKETRDGMTHSYGDACVPPHMKSVTQIQADLAERLSVLVGDSDAIAQAIIVAISEMTEGEEK